MKRLPILLVLGAAGYLGYTYYVGRRASDALPLSSDTMVIRQTEKPKELMNVLGAATQRIFTQGTAVLNDATDGKAEPIINKAVSDLQEKVKDLPEEQYKKVKYEFCRDVIPSSSPVKGD